jgi:hypothetical protein
MSCYIKEYYKVPADIGRRVEVDGKEGIIVKLSGHYLKVNFDNDKPNHIVNVHPTWRIKYLEMGNPRKLTRSQARYQRYLSYGDAFDSFLSFCRRDISNSPQKT